MERRAFLYWVGVGTLASSLPVAIAACSADSGSKTSTSPSPDTAQNPSQSSPVVRNGYATVGTVQTLDQSGSIQAKDFAAGPLLVVRNPNDKTKLVAVNATCTHKGCFVDWNAKEQVFVCPCHDSKFKPDGSVAQGPADKPLATFSVKTEGDSVLVKAS